MAFNFKTFWAGIKIKPKTTSTANSKGDLEVIDGTGKLGFHNGSTVSPVVTESHAASLTNKTIDVSTNTVITAASGNLAATELNAALAELDSDIATKVSGPASATLHAIARFDGTTGKLIENSSVTISNAGVIGRAAGLTFFASAGNLTFTPVTTGESIFNYAVKHNNSVFRTPQTDATAGVNLSLTVGDKSTIVLTAATSIDTLIPYLAYDGQIVTLVNGTASPITLNNETGAIVGGRIRTGSETNYVLPSFGSIVLTYSTTLSRWSLNGGNTALVDHLNDAVDAHDASAISNVPSGNLAATEVQGALNELQSDIDTRALQTSLNTTNTNLSDHLADAIDAHDASAISVVPTGNLVAIEVQAALVEHQGDIDTINTTLANKITGPASATDNRLLRADGTTGKLAQDSVVSLSDAGALTGATSLTVDDITINGNVISSTGSVTIESSPGALTGINNVNITGIFAGTFVESYASGANAVVDALTAKNIVLLDPALTSIALITPQVDGQEITLLNKTGASITLLNNVASGTANRPIITGTGSNLVLANGAAIALNWYSSTTQWNVIGGTGSGSAVAGGVTDPDALLIQNFDTAVVGDFTQTGLAFATTNSLNGAQSALLTHAASTQSFKQTLSVSPKFRGVNLTASILLRSTAASGNVTILVRDETNAVTLTSQSLQTDSQIVSGLSRTSGSPIISGFSNTVINTLSIGMSVTGTGIPAQTRILSISTTANTITLTANATATLASSAQISISALPKTLQLGFNVPANCASLSYTISALAETGAETYIDDVVFRNYFLGTSVQGQSEIQVPLITTQSSYVNNATAITAGSSVVGATSTTGGSSSSIYSYNSGTGVYTILENCIFDISVSLTTSNVTPIQARISKNGSVVMQSGSNASGAGFSANTMWSGNAIIGDTFLATNGNGTTSNNYVTATATAYSTDSITVNEIVPARSVLGNTTIDVPVLTDWQAYTPTFQGFGTPTNVEFQWRQNGENVDIRGKFTSGTATAVEARIGLPNGYNSASTARIPSISIFGRYGATSSTPNSPNGSGNILVEPNVAHATFSGESTAGLSVTKQTGSTLTTNGNTISFFASVPISGLTATEEVVVSGTQSALIQEADSIVRLSAGTSTGLSANVTNIPFGLLSSEGSAITWNGNSATINTTGTYNLTGQISITVLTATWDVKLFKNGVELRRLVNQNQTTTFLPFAFTENFIEGDVISLRTGTAGLTTSNSADAHLQITHQGSLSVASVNADQKITIPTSELRFEGASSRGATATAIVRFDTVAKIRGDAFTVVSDATNGTAVTMTKAGKLDVSTSLNAVSSNFFFITRNQQLLTSTGTLPERLAMASTEGGFDDIACASVSVFVGIGDIIRISSTVNPNAAGSNSLNLSFQEQSIQVSVSNTLPQFSESDTSLRLSGANGFGSTATTTRRFSSVLQNIGTDVQYTDSPTLGGQFTALASGIYNVSYSEQSLANSANSYIMIRVNGVIVSFDNQIYNTTSTGDKAFAASWSGYLNVGDIITSTVAAAAANDGNAAFFTISKVGKPNVTGVNVTPFVNVPQPERQANYFAGGAFAAGAAITGAASSSEGAGIFSYNSATGIYTILKKCVVNFTGTVSASTALPVQVSLVRNSVQVAAGNSSVQGNGFAGSASTNFISNIGDTFFASVQGSGTTSAVNVSFVAQSTSDQILTAPETFSTDTASLQYASSAAYTLATLNTAPVGTYITFTYAINTNTRTQTTTRPTQTDADMNANGIRIFTRAFNAASLAASPSTVAISIGKGLKGVTNSIYGSIGKSNSGSLDYSQVSSTYALGAEIVSYNELTGILLVDAGNNSTTLTTDRQFRMSDLSGPTSGYLVINASKNPALTGFGITQKVGGRGISTTGQSIATGTNVTVTYNTTPEFDSSNAFTTASGIYTVPESGFYQVSGQISYAANTWSANQVCFVYIAVNGTIVAQGGDQMSGGANGTVVKRNVSSGLNLVKGQQVTIIAFHNRGAATALSTDAGSVFLSILKTSIGN